MKRQIKFRGIKESLKEWTYGYLVLDPLNGVRIYSKPFEGATNNTYYYVDPNTVGQFTGLLDRSGKEIYEGDIITVNEKYPKLIKFKDNCASFCLANISDLCEKADCHDWKQANENWWNSFKENIKIIGNIHDNPELLKGGKA